MVNLHTANQLSSTAHAMFKRNDSAKVAKPCGNLLPPEALGTGRFGPAGEVSMRIDRATTEKAAAMLGVTLSFLFLLALIAFAFS
jgi:hypothetical protein